MFCNYIAGKPTNQDLVVVNENSETYTSVTVCSDYCTILRSRKESPRPRQHSAPFCQKFSRGLFEKESVDSRLATVGGGNVIFKLSFLQWLGVTRASDPPSVPCGHRLFSCCFNLSIRILYEMATYVAPHQPPSVFWSVGYRVTRVRV